METYLQLGLLSVSGVFCSLLGLWVSNILLNNLSSHLQVQAGLREDLPAAGPAVRHQLLSLTAGPAGQGFCLLQMLYLYGRGRHCNLKGN